MLSDVVWCGIKIISINIFMFSLCSWICGFLMGKGVAWLVITPAGYKIILLKILELEVHCIISAEETDFNICVIVTAAAFYSELIFSFCETSEGIYIIRERKISIDQCELLANKLHKIQMAGFPP